MLTNEKIWRLWADSASERGHLHDEDADKSPASFFALPGRFHVGARREPHMTLACPTHGISCFGSGEMQFGRDPAHNR